MIIAFYPGACGNRYLQYLLGNEWSQHHVSYDNMSCQLFEHRYLLSPVVPVVQEYTLTHSMNSAQINHAFPNEPIVFIKSNLQQSLRREWLLHGNERYSKKKTSNDSCRIEHYYAIKDQSWPDIASSAALECLPMHILKEVNANYLKMTNPVGVIQTLALTYAQKIESAYENIHWHLDYYKKYSEDFSNAEMIIDIESADTTFSKVVKNELNLYSSEVFDDVWNTLND